MNRRHAALLVGLVLACQPRPAAVPPAAAVEEKTVRPNANAEFLKPDLEVAPWTERFEREGREIYEKRREIVAAARLKKGTAVADVGAGTGLFTLLFAEAVGPEGQVYAVDIAPRFVAHIEKRAAEAGAKNVKTVLCTERSVELPEASVDVVFLCDTYHHFEYPRSSLASIRRALRPGGEVVLIDFKREPGKSADWVLTHVRAGQTEVIRELEAAGFEKTEEIPLLKDNYMLRFRKK